jgi:hypothetical protein
MTEGGITAGLNHAIKPRAGQGSALLPARTPVQVMDYLA